MPAMVLAADNLHALNPVVAEAMRTLDPAPIQAIAKRCAQSGARYLDINPGYLSARQEDRIVFLIEAVQEACSLDLILDSPHARILAKGLPACRKPPILSALTLEPPKLQEILPLAAEHQTPLVVLLLDARSVAPTAVEEKLALAIELREHALAAGMAHDQLIFDPVLPNLTWPDGFAHVGGVVRTVHFLSSGVVFNEPALTMAGLSNLRSGARALFARSIELTCLGMLAGAGLSILLANALDAELHEALTWIGKTADG